MNDNHTNNEAADMGIPRLPVLRQRHGHWHNEVGRLLARYETYAIQRPGSNIPVIEHNRPAVELQKDRQSYLQPGLIQLLKSGKNGGLVVWLSLEGKQIARPKSPIQEYGFKAEEPDDMYDALLVELAGHQAVLQGVRGETTTDLFMDPEDSYGLPPVEAFARACIFTCMLPSEKIVRGCTPLLQRLVSLQEDSPK